MFNVIIQRIHLTLSSNPPLPYSSTAAAGSAAFFAFAFPGNGVTIVIFASLAAKSLSIFRISTSSREGGGGGASPFFTTGTGMGVTLRRFGLNFKLVTAP